MSVDFITFCCHKDYQKLHAPNVLPEMVRSHWYLFNQVIVVHQRIRGIEYEPFEPFEIPVRIVESEDYHPGILTEFGLDEDDPKANLYTHGPDAPHYWKWHVINHLIGLRESQADYIIFSDADCTIKYSNPEASWVEVGIDLLEKHSDILIVSPGDGGQMAERRLDNGVRLTQNVSQQVFLCHRERMEKVNFGLYWDWEYLAPGEPMQEYYYMLEGRIWRYLHKHNLWRAILPDTWRYWHWQWH